MVKYECPVAEIKTLCGKFQAHAENFYLTCLKDESESQQLYFVALLTIRRKPVYVLKRLPGIGSADSCVYLAPTFAEEILKVDTNLKPDMSVSLLDINLEEAVILAGSHEEGLSEFAKVETKLLTKPLFDLDDNMKTFEDMPVSWNDEGLAIHDMSEYRVVFNTTVPGDKYEIYSILSVLSVKFKEAYKAYAVKPATTQNTPTPPPAGRTKKEETVAKAATIVQKETKTMSEAVNTTTATVVTPPTAPVQAPVTPPAPAGDATTPPAGTEAAAGEGTTTPPEAGGKPRVKRTKEQIHEAKTAESIEFLTTNGYTVEKAEGTSKPMDDLKLLTQKLSLVVANLAAAPVEQVIAPELRQQIELEVRETVKKEMLAKMAGL
jgi:hypothetical protein